MQPGSTITPSGSGPDQDKNNPFNKKWESPSPTEEISRSDVDDGINKLEKFANDPDNATKKQPTAAKAESDAGGSGRGGNDSATLPGEGGFSYSPKAKKSGRFKLTRKQSIAAGAAGFIGGGLLFAAIPLLAPLKLMQFGNLLRQAHFFNLEDFGDDRTSKLTMLRRYNNLGTFQATRLSGRAAKSAIKWDARLLDKSGVKMVYSSTGRFVGFEIVDPEKAADLVREWEKYDIPDHEGSRNNLNTGIDGNRDIRTSNSRILRVDQIRDPTGLKRRGMVKSAVNSVELGKISSGLGTRKLRTLSGVGFHPIDDALRKIVDAGVDRWAERKQEADVDRERRLRNGDVDVRLNGDGKEQTVDRDGETVVDEDATRDSIELGNETNTELDKVEGASTKAELDAIKRDWIRRIKTSAAAAAVVSVMCGVKDLGDQVEGKNYQNVLIMQRMAMENIALASQIPTLNGLSWGSIRYFWDLMTDDEGGDALAQATNMQQGGSYKEGELYANARYDSGSSKPFLFEILDSIPLLGTACAVQDKANSFLSAIPVVGDIIDKASDIALSSLNVLLEGVSGYTIDDVIGLVVDFLANDGVNAVAEGALRGVLSMYGGLYASNDDYHASGARALTPTEVGELNDYKKLALKQERQEKDLFARIFDASDTESVIAQAIESAPNTHKSATQKFASLFNPFNPVVEYVGGFGVTPAIAADEFDYGVSRFGFSRSEIESDIADDPYENAAIVEDLNGEYGEPYGLENLNAKYGDCFPTTLTSEGRVIFDSFTEDRVNQFSTDDKCNDPADEALLRYRFYLYDTVALTSLNCYEGDEESCVDIGMNVDITTGPAGSLGLDGEVTLVGDKAFPLAVNKSQVGGDIFVDGDTNQAGHPYIAYDLIAAKGTDVVSMTAGKVVRISSSSGGKVASITINIPEQGISLWYGHLDPATIQVQKGEVVSAGSPLAKLVDHRVDEDSGADHLHIDASVNEGDHIFRPPCKRSRCEEPHVSRFISIGPDLYELYEALPE